MSGDLFVDQESPPAVGEILSTRVNPKVSIINNSTNAILSFVRDGQGITSLPWIDASREVEAGRLIIRPLASSRLTETHRLAISRGKQFGDLAVRVMAEIQSTLRKLWYWAETCPFCVRAEYSRNHVGALMSVKGELGGKTSRRYLLSGTRKSPGSPQEYIVCCEATSIVPVA